MQMPDCQFTVIIPVYNEEENLNRVEKELIAFLKKAIIPAKFLFINDGSTDNSQQMIEDICERNEAFHYICFAENAGLSALMRAGFDYINTPFIGYIDSDLQTNPEDFNLLLKYRNDFQLVTGVRTHRKDDFIRNFSSKFANRFRQIFTCDGVEDTACPLKVIQTEYAKRIPMFKGLHRFLPAMIQLQGGKVKQIPVRHYERIAGKAKFGVMNRLLGPLTDCFAFLWMKKKYIKYKVAKTSL